MIEVNGVIYRNLEEQVQKNKDDIENLQNQQSGDDSDIEQINNRLTEVETNLSEITPDVMRALKTPISRPNQLKIVAVDTTNSQEMLNVGTGLVVEDNTLKLSGGTGGGSNPNLLINGDFRVNQRGQTNYNFTGKGSYLRYYSIDRWFGVPQIANSQSNLIVNNKSITINMIEPNFNFQQIIEYSERLSNKSITASIKCSNQSSNKAYMSISNGSTRLGIREIPNGSGIYTLTINLGEINDFRFQIGTEMGNVQLEIEWCKLEIGSVATAFNPRPYAEELDLCQRYYQRFKIYNSAIFGLGIVFESKYLQVPISTPVTLRVSPTISMSTTMTIQTGNFESYNIKEYSVRSFLSNQIVIRCVSSGLTTDKIYMLRGSGGPSVDDYIAFDAEMY